MRPLVATSCAENAMSRMSLRKNVSSFALNGSAHSSAAPSATDLQRLGGVLFCSGSEALESWRQMLEREGREVTVYRPCAENGPIMVREWSDNGPRMVREWSLKRAVREWSESGPSITERYTFEEVSAKRLTHKFEVGGRAALAQRRSDVEDLYLQTAHLGDAVSGMAFPDLCRLLRVLTSSGYLPEERLLDAAEQQLDSHLSGAGAAADAAAHLALSACEASGGPGPWRALGVRAVEALCARDWRDLGRRLSSEVGDGTDGGDGGRHLGGAGAAALALAATVCGRAEPQLLEALIGRCSVREMDLNEAALGDLRLTAVLAGKGLRN
ncbi:unnamed protein product [Polarella glacialis]|uniref:Uncharacterized protein n=1 Tax=Polarella glacialis TaxID=89957 RepID=A0A813LNH1_POLGL|nr:unnamed protein product [Polarella glacialis]